MFILLYGENYSLHIFFEDNLLSFDFSVVAIFNFCHFETAGFEHVQHDVVNSQDTGIDRFDSVIFGNFEHVKVVS